MKTPNRKQSSRAAVQNSGPPNETSTPRLPATLAGYPGSKGAAGLAERIIRQMPPHTTYIEAFAGGAAVFRRKRPADRSILIDADPAVCEALRAAHAEASCCDVVCDSVIDWLAFARWAIDGRTLLYLDPPYLRETRTRLLYDFEFHSPDEHTALIALLVKLPCMVMLSGYRSKLYAKLLKNWRTVDIPAMTRGGKRIETLWCNFEEPELLHDPRFAGGDFRERENIARKRKRWAAKFAKMDRRERQAVAVALAESDRLAVEMALRSAAIDSPLESKK